MVRVLLGWGTGTSCLFPSNEAALLIWKTVHSCLFQGNNAECSVIGIQCDFPFLMVTVLCWDEIVSWFLKVNSLVRLQSVFPFLVITFLCWDEIVSWCLSSELWTVKDQYILLEFSKVHDKLDGYVFSLVFFDVTAPNSLFEERFSLVFFDITAVIISAEFTVWGTIQSCLFRCNSGHHSAFIIDHSAFIIRHSSFIHQSTSNQKSIKNQSKIVPKSFQNPTKIGPGGVLEGSWTHLGGVLETFSIWDPYF